MCMHVDESGENEASRCVDNNTLCFEILEGNAFESGDGLNFAATNGKDAIPDDVCLELSSSHRQERGVVDDEAICGVSLLGVQAMSSLSNMGRLRDENFLIVEEVLDAADTKVAFVFLDGSGATRYFVHLNRVEVRP